MSEQKKKATKPVRITFRGETQLKELLDTKKNKSKFIRDAIFSYEQKNDVYEQILKQLIPVFIEAELSVSLKTSEQEQILEELIKEIL